MNDSVNTEQQLHAARKTGRPVRYVVVVCLLLTVLAVAAGMTVPSWRQSVSGESPREAAPDGRAIPVRTIVAEQTSFYTQTQSYVGIVKARRVSELSFSRAARLVRLRVNVGDVTKVGATLAELDTDHLEAQKAMLEVSRSRAKAELTKRIAAVQLPTTRAIRAEIAALRSQLEQLERASNADRDDTPAIPIPTPANAPDDLVRARQRLEALEAVTRDENIAAQEAVVAELDGQLAELQTALQGSKLTAPFDGAIAQQYLNEGAVISPGVPVMRIVEQSDPQLWVGIPSAAAAEVSQGDAHVVLVGDQRLNATVFAKLPELDRTTRTRTVVFSLPSSDVTPILPGHVARIEVRRRIRSEGFWLPISSLTREARGLWSIYVVPRNEGADQFVARRYVEVIHQDGERARVQGMLDPGDLIIVDGLHRVVPGQKAEVQTVEHERDDAGSDSGRLP